MDEEAVQWIVRQKYKGKGEYASPIEDQHLPTSLAAWGKNQPTVYINMSESNKVAEVAATMYNNKL